MVATEYPKTVKRGHFKGTTFSSHAEYLTALDAAKANGQVKERTRKTAPGSGNANGVTRAMASSLVSYANIVLVVVPYTREDALDETESEALTLGIIETARANKYFANLIVKTCQMQSGSRLAFAVGAIVARRVARREILPVDARMPVELGSMMLLNLLAQEANIVPETVPEVVTEPVSQNGHVDVAPGEMVDPFNVAAR